MYRPRRWQQQERQKAKLLKSVSWYRPADTVLFLPATSDGELAELAKKVAEEEGPRLGLNIRVVEKGGVSLKRTLVRTDLAAGEPCKQADCQACLSNPGEGGGLLHQRAGALSRGTCFVLHLAAPLFTMGKVATMATPGLGTMGVTSGQGASLMPLPNTSFKTTLSHLLWKFKMLSTLKFSEHLKSL